MSISVVLAFDFGTTAIKAALFDSSLRMLARESYELSYRHPGPGMVELDDDVFLMAVADLSERLLRGGEYAVEVISITSQAETVTAIDAEGSALRPSIIWLDNRAVAEHGCLSALFPDRAFYRHTGLVGSDAILPINKIAWIKAREPEIYRRTSKFLLLKDYVIFRLTGALCTDPSIASTSGMYDICEHRWWAEPLAAHGISEALLPEVVPSDRIVGYVMPDLCVLPHIASGTPVVCGLLDQAASALGAGNLEPGMISETTGTALAVAMVLPRFEPGRHDTLIPVIEYGFGGRYLTLPYHAVSAMALKWFADGFCQEEKRIAKARGVSVYRLIDDMVAQLSELSDLYFIPHLCGRTFPGNDPCARGVLMGMDLGTDKAQVARAIMESVGYLLSEMVALLGDYGCTAQRIYSMGGASGSPLWNQMKADIVGREIVTIKNPETTALGAAVIAAYAAGMIPSIDAAKDAVEFGDCYAPDANLHAAYAPKEQRFQALLRCCERFWQR